MILFPPLVDLPPNDPAWWVHTPRADGVVTEGYFWPILFRMFWLDIVVIAQQCDESIHGWHLRWDECHCWACGRMRSEHPKEAVK